MDMCKTCGREAALLPSGCCDAWCEHYGAEQQEAEQATFEGDTMALLRLVDALVDAYKRRRRNPTTEEWERLEETADAVRCWYEQGDDPRSMGWTDDRGRP